MLKCNCKPFQYLRLVNYIFFRFWMSIHWLSHVRTWFFHSLLVILQIVVFLYQRYNSFTHFKRCMTKVRWTKIISCSKNITPRRGRSDFLINPTSIILPGVRPSDLVCSILLHTTFNRGVFTAFYIFILSIYCQVII